MTSWSGLGESQRKFNERAANIDATARRFVVEASALMIRSAQSQFQGSHRKGEPHVGGNRPNVVTGDLRRSITPDPIMPYGTGGYSIKFGPRMIYARSVELGNKPGMAAYPYFRPGMQASKLKVAALAKVLFSSAAKF